MLGSEILDVAIGIIFVYLLMSVICSAVREVIEAVLKTRAAYLERGIRELLHDPHALGAAKQLFNHPLIFSLFPGTYTPQPHVAGKPAWNARGGMLPSYIPAKNFAAALIDLAARGPVNDPAPGATAPLISLDTIRANAAKLDNPQLQRVLLTAIDSAQGDINRLQANLENWFDSGMDRVSGWYKRSTQWIVFWVAAGLTVLMNVNTIRIADYLYRHDATRSAIVQSASVALQNGAAGDYNTAKQELQTLQLPVGWHEGFAGSLARSGTGRLHPFDVILALFGWAMTAFASTLGAPFWFDVLNKVMVIRSTVKPREKSPEEGSEDRQMPTQNRAATTTNGGGNTAAAPPPVAAPPPIDAELETDACEVDFTKAASTSDEQLPAAQGGVAS